MQYTFDEAVAQIEASDNEDNDEAIVIIPPDSNHLSDDNELNEDAPLHYIPTKVPGSYQLSKPRLRRRSGTDI